MTNLPSTSHHYPTSSILFLALSIAPVLSCDYGILDISSVPDNPTFGGDVYPLFADHCLVCHGSPPNRGAPAYFRLDQYDDAPGVVGAKSMAASAAGDVQSGRMPPASSFGDRVGPNGLQMLQRWVQDGSPR